VAGLEVDFGICTTTRSPSRDGCTLVGLEPPSSRPSSHSSQARPRVTLEAWKSKFLSLTAFPEHDEVAQGKIVIATVEGDVHDIGKTIVATLFKANGFDVIDLGRDVPTARIIEAAETNDADIIGTSTLLTTTMTVQKDLEEVLKEAGLRDKYKTIVGGAPVTKRWADRIGADAYANDAVDGVRIAKELMKG